jgi:hypothetical protein
LSHLHGLPSFASTVITFPDFSAENESSCFGSKFPLATKSKVTSSVFTLVTFTETWHFSATIAIFRFLPCSSLE